MARGVLLRGRGDQLDRSGGESGQAGLVGVEELPPTHGPQQVEMPPKGSGSDLEVSRPKGFDEPSCYVVCRFATRSADALGDEPMLFLPTPLLNPIVDGPSVDVDVHRSWRGNRLLARTLDLKSAYRQLAISTGDLPLDIIGFTSCVQDIVKVLAVPIAPLWATASAYSFNKCSRSIEVILCKLSLVVASSYYDEFPIPERASTSRTCTIM
eukprot:3563866-Amphidinium_carterae.1